MVELIWQHERRVLRDLTAEAIANGSKVFKKIVGELSRFRVVNAAGKLVLYGPMLRRAEVVLEIKYKNTAPETVLAKMPLQMTVETVHCEVNAFAFNARGIIIDKCRLKNFRDNTVA